jgi:hypothetical protein
MTIPNDDSKPDVPANDGAVPPAPAAGSVPPAAEPVPPAAAEAPVAPPATSNASFPPAPPAAPGAFPSYAATPGAPVAAPTEPPQPINIAFWLYIAAAALSVISGIVTAIIVSGQRDQFLDSLRSSGVDDSASAVDAVIGFAIAWAVITLIFWALVFVLFAIFMRRGANWARIVLTVVTALSLLNLLASFGLGALQVIVAVVATVLIWLKPASAYFAAVRASKAPRA